MQVPPDLADQLAKHNAQFNGVATDSGAVGDEPDALGRARGVNPVAALDEKEQTLNQLLAEMDGVRSLGCDRHPGSDQPVMT